MELKDCRAVSLNDGQQALFVQGSAPCWTVHACERVGELRYALKGIYRINSRVLVPDFDSARFDKTGLTLRLVLSSQGGRSEFEVLHRFDFTHPQDSFEFLSGKEYADIFLSDFEGQPGGFLWSPQLAEARRSGNKAPAAGRPAQPESAIDPAELPLRAEGEATALRAVCHKAADGSEHVTVLSKGGYADAALESGLARPVALPDNRVTRALSRTMMLDEAEERGMSIPKAALIAMMQGEDEVPFLRPGDEVPAERLAELWYRVQLNMAFCDSWFCDEAGNYLVFVGGSASGAVTDEFLLFRWDEQKQLFVNCGSNYYVSRALGFNPSLVEFDDRGMRLNVIVSSQDGATRFRYTHYFDYRTPGDKCYLISDRELCDVFWHALTDAARVRELARQPFGTLELPASARESGYLLPIPGEESTRPAHVAVGGELHEQLRSFAAASAQGSTLLGEAGPLPDNRVTRVLGQRYAPLFDWRQKRYPEILRAGLLIPAEELHCLYWHMSMLMNRFGRQMSWFCDKSGTNLVFVGVDDIGSCELHVYRWAGPKGVFRRVGLFRYESGGLELDAANALFEPGGMRLPFTDGRGTTQWEFFPFEAP